MANEKISAFAVDSAIEGVDGLAAMRITNPNTADPQGGVPVEFGNVAVPGFAFTLENILKGKTDRSDLTDSGNWTSVISNRVPRGTQTGTNVDYREGLTFGGDTSNTDFPDLLTIQGSADPSTPSTLEFIGYEKGGNFQSQPTPPIEYSKVRWKYIEEFKVTTATSSTGCSIQLHSTNSTRTGNEIEIYAGRDAAGVNSANSIHIWNRNKGGNVKLESANDIFIETGVGAGSGPGASKKLYIRPSNSTSANGQVLTAQGNDGEAEWADQIDTQYDLNTVELTGGDVKVQLRDDAATPNVVGDMLFEKGDGITFEDITTGANGSFKVSQSIATGTTFGGIKIGYAQNNKNYPVVLDNTTDKAYVNVPWTDTQNVYTAGDGLALNGGEFSIEAPLGYSFGGTGANSANEHGVVYAGATEYSSDDFFTFKITGDATAAAKATLSVGEFNTGSPTAGYQGVIKVLGQGDSSVDPIESSGIIEIQCQTGVHNFHIVGPDHNGMGYSPGIVLPNDIGTSGQVLVLDAVPGSGSVRTATTKWESPANNKKAFISLLAANGTATSWDIKNGYNAKIDFAASSGTEYDFTTNTITATDGDYGTLVVINGATAGTVEFPASSRWVGGNTPTATDGGVDIYSFIYDGTNYYWTYGLDNKA